METESHSPQCSCDLCLKVAAIPSLPDVGGGSGGACQTVGGGSGGACQMVGEGSGGVFHPIHLQHFKNNPLCSSTLVCLSTLVYIHWFVLMGSRGSGGGEHPFVYQHWFVCRHWFV